MNDNDRKRIADELIVRLSSAASPDGSKWARERPIDFAPHLIDLILAGQKTQTRRPHRPANDYKAGDRLWVREKWAKLEEGCMIARLNPSTDARWFSPLFMPKSAAKLWLLVDEVRIEPIQSITKVDLRAEGFADENPIEAFRTTWDSFYAQQGLGWDRNPNVVVVEFRILKTR